MMLSVRKTNKMTWTEMSQVCFAVYLSCHSAESLTWKLEMCSLSRGLVTDSWPEIGLMMKIPFGGWSAPGPVTLYRSIRFLSRSERI